MQTLTVERTIAAPIEKVFDWFADTGNFADARMVFQTRLLEPAPGNNPYDVGAVQRIIWAFGSYHIERITAHEAPHRLAWVIERGFPAVRHEGAELAFTEVAGGTRVVLTTTTEVAIPIAADFFTRNVGLPVLAAGYRDLLEAAEVAITSRRRQQLTRRGWLAKPRNYVFDTLLKMVRNTHHFVLKVSGGRWGNRQFGMHAIELHVIGRKSKARRTVVMWVPIMEQDRVIMVASKEGDDRDPEWYKNLVATPEVELTIDGVTSQWTARTATPWEKADLWPKIVKVYHGFAVYQSRTNRDIPVVICEPRTAVKSIAPEATKQESAV